MRYQIIDMDKIRSGECAMTNPDGNTGINVDLALLSEEETLAKFKEILKEGYNSWKYNHIDQHWEEFKKEL